MTVHTCSFFSLHKTSPKIAKSLKHLRGKNERWCLLNIKFIFTFYVSCILCVLVVVATYLNKYNKYYFKYIYNNIKV